MGKKIFTLAAGLLLAGTGAAGAASAAPAYADSACSITTSGPVVRGSSITIGTYTFKKNKTVSFTLTQGTTVLHPSSSTANNDGYASTTYVIPTTAPAGTYAVTTSGTPPTGSGTKRCTSSLTASSAGGATIAGITVERAPAAVVADPAQGPAPLTKVALGAVAAGGLVVLAGNRRRSSKVDQRETASV